jgi:anti-sigma regulatory factor (Ser/Thr protein kinase)
MKSNRIEISIPAKPQFLKIIRLTVRHICEVVGFSKEDHNNITLAVDEACTNIIKHTYEGATAKPIHFSCEVHKDRVEFFLRDFGKKLNISDIKSRQLDDIRPGGLGVHLIKSVMDEVVYENDFETGNQIHLIKYLPQKDNQC